MLWTLYNFLKAFLLVDKLVFPIPGFSALGTTAFRPQRLMKTILALWHAFKNSSTRLPPHILVLTTNETCLFNIDNIWYYYNFGWRSYSTQKQEPLQNKHEHSTHPLKNTKTCNNLCLPYNTLINHSQHDTLKHFTSN